MFRSLWQSFNRSPLFSNFRRPFSSRPDTSSLWQQYNKLLETHPLMTKCITAGAIAAVADVTCQVSFPSDEDANKSLLERMDWKRTRNFTIVNTFLFPPLAHYWYGFLSVKIVGTTFMAAIKRVVLDQMLFAPVLLASFFSAVLLVNGESDRIPDKLRNDLPTTILTNYTVWIPAQLINFQFVPIPYRVLWANAVGFFWNIYLSYAAVNGTSSSAGDTEKKEGK
ncbi:MAG: Mpv17/PMP22 family protein [Verrucomicrobiaceae bacterium]|nr:MAG: Mpv17/PMP22 family protein [Verrucomicrobiaceae bacterium]